MEISIVPCGKKYFIQSLSVDVKEFLQPVFKHSREYQVSIFSTCRFPFSSINIVEPWKE